MPVTRIKNNQVTDASGANTQLGINANTKLQNYSITSTKIANNLVYGSDLTVTGNLTVQGNSTAIDTTITTIEDPIIVLASTQTSGAPAVDIGYLGFRGNESNIAFVWDESAGQFVTAFTSTGESNTTITITSYANLQIGNLSLTGNILNSSLNVTGNITGGNLLTPGLISATSTITSAADITGGNILTGGLISATSTITSAANITGGNILTGGLISATSTITSAANITGANILTGGLITATGNVTGGNVLTGGLISATSTITSAANISGSNLLTGGLISATSTITSAANVTGANVITGGLITATGNITGGNLLTSGSGGTISGTGNIIGGNILTGGLISAAGNITSGSGSFFIGNGSQLTGVIASSAGFPVSNGTSNINAAVNANITVGVAGTSNVAVFASTGVFVTGVNSVSGNVTGANVNTAGLITATGNITGGNILTPGLISAAGLATSGNVATAGTVSATGNIDTAGNINLAGNIFDSGSLTITTASGDITLNASGNINAGTNYINGVVDPVQDQDAATKIYVDNRVSTSISYHESVVAATTGNLDAATGGTVTYAQPNGAANGIGATLTTTGTFNLIDTANVQSANTRILVKDQANAVQNGVYVWSNATVITRASSENTAGAGNVDALGINDYFFTTGGNVNRGTAFIVDAPSTPIVFGTSNIQFAIFSQSQVYSANTLAGLVLNGTVFSAKVDEITTAFDVGGNIIVKASANLTTPNIGAATGTSLSATGNIASGGNLIATGFVTATGNVAGGNVTTAGLVTATGTITGGNLVTAGLITATGDISGGNVLTAGLISATGNVTGGNILTAGLVSATGTITSVANITGGNVLTGGLISATSTITSAANITGGNLLTGGLISATGAVTSGGFTTTGNVTGGNLLYGSGIVSGTGNVYAANFIGNISGNIDAGGANTNIQFNDSDLLNGSAGFTFNKVGNVVTANGNITGATLISNGNILATSAANVTFGDNTWFYSGYTVLNTGGIFHDTGANPDTIQISTNSRANGIALVTIGLANSSVVSTGGIEFVTDGTLNANTNPSGGVSRVQITTNGLTANGIVSASGNVTGANLILTAGIIDGPAAGRITINGSDIDTDFAVDGDTLANVFYVDAGTGTASFGASTQITNAIVNFATTTSIKTPVGNTAQRPGTGVTGMLRFNTTSNALEVYDNSAWSSVGVPVFTVIDDEQFAGDGSTLAFTLGSTQTTNSCIVSINGVVQIPTLAYAVAGTDPTCVLTFTEAPAAGDVIDVRQITTTTSVTSIANSSGNAVIAVSATAAQTNVTGDLSVSGSILGGNINSTAITNGNSNVSVVSSGGNIAVNVGGNGIISFTSSGIINNMGNGVGNIGNATGYFNTIFAQSTSAQYADLAEKYTADADYAPGTVVMFGGSAEVTRCVNDACSRVAGVISTNPSYRMNDGLVSEHTAMVALTGRVPTRVTGTVRKGDMIVSAGNGIARAEANPQVGTVIGKALADSQGDAVIEVVVGRV